MLTNDRHLDGLMNNYAARAAIRLSGEPTPYWLIDCARALSDEYGIFAQVRGMTHGNAENAAAVFYAGRRAWEDNLKPFASIALKDIDFKGREL